MDPAEPDWILVLLWSWIYISCYAETKKKQNLSSQLLLMHYLMIFYFLKQFCFKILESNIQNNSKSQINFRILQWKHPFKLTQTKDSVCVSEGTYLIIFWNFILINYIMYLTESRYTGLFIFKILWNCLYGWDSIYLPHFKQRSVF